MVLCLFVHSQNPWRPGLNKTRFLIFNPKPRSWRCLKQNSLKTRVFASYFAQQFSPKSTCSVGKSDTLSGKAVRITGHDQRLNFATAGEVLTTENKHRSGLRVQHCRMASPCGWSGSQLEPRTFRPWSMNQESRICAVPQLCYLILSKLVTMSTS